MVPGLFGLFFKKEPLVIKVNIEQIPMLIESDFALKKNELEEFSAKKLSEAKYLHSRSLDLLKRISEKELEGKPNERFNKAALTSKKQLEIQLKKILDKINPTERGKTLDDARHYSGESFVVLVNEINSFRKNIVYTSVYLKEDMKELGEALQEMMNIFSSMNQEFSKHNDLFEFEKVKTAIGELIKKKKTLLEAQKNLGMLNEAASNKQRALSSQNDFILTKKTGKEMLAVNNLEEEMTALMNEKQDLKTEISALLLNIDRPLQRFKQLVDSNRWRLPKEEKEMLEQFIVNPIIALKKDPKAELFKKVLLEIRKAIEDGSVELKDKEKEKRLAALQEIINFDFFGKVFWKMNEIQKKQTELTKEIEKNAAKKEVETETAKAKELEGEGRDLKEKIAFAEKQLANTKKEIESDLEKVRLFAEKTLGKTIIFEEENY